MEVLPLWAVHEGFVGGLPISVLDGFFARCQGLLALLKLLRGVRVWIDALEFVRLAILPIPAPIQALGVRQVLRGSARRGRLVGRFDVSLHQTIRHALISLRIN